MSWKSSTFETIHLVSSQTEHPPCQCYRVGERVPLSGIYRAFHDGHRLAHDVTLLAGGVFPRCNKCGITVHFELVSEAPSGMNDRDFRVQLYEIPHPDNTAVESPGQPAA